jgi:ribosomal-protein-alanine N-acetyltransferase
MLIGKNVRLAEYEPALAPLLTEWMNDPEYWGPFYNVWTSTEPQWEAELAKDSDAYQRVSFVIRSRDDDRPLGTIGFFTPFTLSLLHRAFEIWYQVHPGERRRGVGHQAAAILVDHLFSSQPVERIQATVVSGNDASCAVLEKVGMQHEGTLRDLFFLRGRFVDLQMYSIVRKDWISEQAYRERFDFLGEQR